MCGIAGFASLNKAPKQNPKLALSAMSELISHRGPDGEGIWISDNSTVGFAHRRLSIIDLSKSASQPMKNKAGNVITYNGEIYNYLELKQICTSKGYRFRGNSDTEVILAGYEFYGSKLPSRLRGMFSFAIWDEKNQEFSERFHQLRGEKRHALRRKAFGAWRKNY